jgi:glyoxylate reductase
MRSKALIVLTHPFIPAVFQTELKGYEVKVAKNPKDLARLLPRAQGLITRVSDRVDATLFERAPQLKVVGNFAVGYDNIDFNACKKFGVRVVNTPDVLSRSVAELTLLLLLAAARRMPEGEALCRKSSFEGWTPTLLLGQELKGRHAVLVGRGRIGKETADLFKLLGISVEWITKKDSPASILNKLKRAQILSLHLSLNSSTHHWLNRQRISQLPRECIVLNTTRGAVIDETALIEALKHRRIFAAGLDVFEKEPFIPPTLRKLPNVVLLPHLGSATLEARTGMARLVCRGVRAILSGKKPSNEVTMEARS